MMETLSNLKNSRDYLSCNCDIKIGYGILFIFGCYMEVILSSSFSNSSDATTIGLIPSLWHNFTVRFITSAAHNCAILLTIILNLMFHIYICDECEPFLIWVAPVGCAMLTSMKNGLPDWLKM